MTTGSSSQGDSAGQYQNQGFGLLTDRIAGQAVIEKLLTDRQAAPPRSFWARVFGSDPLTPENYPWYKGALGEIRVGQVLSSLGHEWRVLHAVPVGTGTSDIDHVLIGPPGVFTINTKNHAGQAIWVAGRTFMVAGKRQRHLYSAVHEAERAAKLLSHKTGKTHHVNAVIVVISPKSIKVRQKPTDVAVLTDRELLKWLISRPAILTPWEVSQLAAAAIQPTTWHRNPPRVVDTAAIWHEFVALQSLMRTARRRRAGWALSFLIGTPLLLLVLSALFQAVG